jgi:deaminated glutathione amidase
MIMESKFKPGILLILLIGVILSIAFIPEIFAQTSPKDLSDGKLRIASCQFPVSADIRQNYSWIRNQMTEAKSRGADIVHFPECALSGYPGTDMMSLENFDWKTLHETTDSILTLAAGLKLWVVLGSMHRLGGNNNPHDCQYVINPDGKIVDRYDKRFCTTGDLLYFSPGDHFVTFNINHVKCGLLICYDVRFPELYREYRKLDTDVIFQSFYNAREEPGGIHPMIMHVTAQARAATDYFYMSLTNSSAPDSWPCYFITPDGAVQNKLPENLPGILISDIDLSKKYYDASEPFRGDAINGKLNSGEIVRDPLSENRTGY